VKLFYTPYEKTRQCSEFFVSITIEGAFHEAVTNQILEDLIAATDPRFMRLKAIFNVRGGVYTTVIAEHQQQGWEPKTVVNL
jgi:7-cyano-7-deazaguanine reductase